MEKMLKKKKEKLIINYYFSFFLSHNPSRWHNPRQPQYTTRFFVVDFTHTFVKLNHFPHFLPTFTQTYYENIYFYNYLICGSSI